MTSDNHILKTFDLPVEIEETDCLGSLECGFREEWISGENHNVSVILKSGAGLANKYLQVSVEFNGTKRYFRCDMRKFLRYFAEMSAPAESDK